MKVSDLLNLGTKECECWKARKARLRQKGRWPVLTDPVGQVTKSHYTAPSFFMLNRQALQHMSWPPR